MKCFRNECVLSLCKKEITPEHLRNYDTTKSVLHEIYSNLHRCAKKILTIMLIYGNNTMPHHPIISMLMRCPTLIKKQISLV